MHVRALWHRRETFQIIVVARRLQQSSSSGVMAASALTTGLSAA